MMDEIYEKFLNDPIIASVNSEELIDEVIKRDLGIVFIVKSDISTIISQIRRLKEHNKVVFVHLDMIDGLSNDVPAITFLKSQVDFDGIITTKGNVIMQAKKMGLLTIQRVFLLDSQSIKTAVANVGKYHPDAIEVLPGIIPKAIRLLCSQVSIPVITGGLVTDKEEVVDALNAGAMCSSGTCLEIWDS